MMTSSLRCTTKTLPLSLLTRPILFLFHDRDAGHDAISPCGGLQFSKGNAGTRRRGTVASEPREGRPRCRDGSVPGGGSPAAVRRVSNLLDPNVEFDHFGKSHSRPARPHCGVERDRPDPGPQRHQENLRGWESGVRHLRLRHEYVRRRIAERRMDYLSRREDRIRTAHLPYRSLARGPGRIEETNSADFLSWELGSLLSSSGIL